MGASTGCLSEPIGPLGLHDTLQKGVSFPKRHPCLSSKATWHHTPKSAPQINRVHKFGREAFALLASNAMARNGGGTQQTTEEARSRFHGYFDPGGEPWDRLQMLHGLRPALWKLQAYRSTLPSSCIETQACQRLGTSENSPESRAGRQRI